MKSSVVTFVLLLCISPLGWAQIATLDRVTAAKKVQVCFQSQVNEHAKAIKQFEMKIGKNHKRIEELELKKEASKVLDGINRKFDPEQVCTDNPEKSISIEEKIEAYKNQNLVLKSFYELNRANLTTLQYEVPLIERYLRVVSFDGYEKNKLLKNVVELEKMNDEYSTSLKKQIDLKDSLKLNLEFPDCTSALKDLKNLH